MSSTSAGSPARLALVGVFIAWAGVSTLDFDLHDVPDAAKSARESSGTGVASSDESKPNAAVQVVQHEGELSEPITSIVKHPKKFLERFEAHGWSGNLVPRDCTGCKSNQHTTVSIGAIEDAHKVDFKNLPPYGVIVARLENIGPWTEARYGIPSHAVWYMLWGGDPSASKPTARFVKVVVKLGIKSLVLDAKSFTIDSCAHKDTAIAEKKPDADFKTCELRAFSSAKADAWISCSQGCCTAGNDTSRTPMSRSRP